MTREDARTIASIALERVLRTTRRMGAASPQGHPGHSRAAGAAEMNHVPAQAFHPSVFILEEMKTRGWDRWELARRMGGDYRQRRLEIDLYFEAGPGQPDLRIGDGEDFALAFGCSAEFFRNLEKTWLAWLRDRQPEPEGRGDG